MYPYPLLYYLGNYLNINIFSFSNFYNKLTNNPNKNIVNKSIKNNTFQSLKKLSKFIKLLMLNFPHVSKNIKFFVFYSVANLKFNDFKQKYFEITQLVNSKMFNEEKNNNILLNNKSVEKDNFSKCYKISNLEINNNTPSIINSNNSKMINTNLNNLNSILTDNSSFIDNSLLIKSFNEKKYLKNDNNKDKNYQKCTNLINSITIINNNKSESNELSKINKTSRKYKTPQIKNIIKKKSKLIKQNK